MLDRTRKPPQRVDEIDWSTWRQTESATLMFIVDGERILLMRKKRGLGAGKINAPGGRIEDGETALECAVRETREELNVTPVAPSLRGRQRFHFVDGYRLTVFCFLSRGYEGRPAETDEARPKWTPLTAIPYDEMWADDALWVPKMLAGELFDGRYIFDDDTMVDHAFHPAPTLEVIAADRPDID